MPLVMGVDSTTRATVVEVRDADTGRLVATGRAPRSSDTDTDSGPQRWWSDMLRAIAAAGERDIASMAVVASAPGPVLLDRAGTALRAPVVADRRQARAQVQRLVDHFGPERWASMVGFVPDADSTIAQLAWLRTTDRSTFDQIGSVLSAHDWLTYRLTGRAVTDRGDASRTGFWSPSTGRWRTDLLARIDPMIGDAEWGTRLPRIVGPTAVADWLTASVHEIVGLRGRPLVSAGSGRRMAIALAAGLGSGHAVVSLGLDGTAAVRTPTPTADQTGRVRNAGAATGDHLALVPMGRIGSGVLSVASLLGVDVGEVDRMARRTPDSGGIVVLGPHIDGVDVAVRGLDAQHRPEQLARAAVEGAACATADALDLLGDAGVAADGPLHLTGTAASSPAHRRLLAELSGRPVVAIEGANPAARGACIQAAAVLAGVDLDLVARAWGRDESPVTEPSGRLDVDGLRARYHDAVGRDVRR